MPLIPAGLALIASYFIKDTPRWYASKGRTIEASNLLDRLRKTNAGEEFDLIDQKARAQAGDLIAGTLASKAKMLFANPRYISRLLLVVFIQIIAQFGGGTGGTVTIFLELVS